MFKIVRTNSENQDFINLVQLLDADLAERDGDEHAFYHQFNNIDVLQHTIVLYAEGKPLGCGALKRFGFNAMEVKRMYVLPSERGKGLASRILNALENWAAEMGVEKCILETGKRQPEAIGLYRKNGYRTIPNYGPYVGVINSVCFEKELGESQ